MTDEQEKIVKRGPRTPPLADHGPVTPADQDMLTRLVAQTEPGPAKAEPKTTQQHVHHVHFLEDGVTALDKIYVRGEEAIVNANNEVMAHDADGHCTFALSAQEQVDRFGKVLWAPGPWPYGGYDLQARLDNGEELTLEERAILKQANEKRGLTQPVGAPPRQEMRNLGPVGPPRVR